MLKDWHMGIIAIVSAFIIGYFTIMSNSIIFEEFLSQKEQEFLLITIVILLLTKLLIMC